MNSLSYSNYTLLRSCGERYRLKVIEKRSEPTVPHFEFGSALHAGLHDALVTKDVESAMDVFDAYWGSATPKLDFTGDRYSAEFMQEMGRKFVANFTRRYAVKMEFVTGEKRLYKELDRSLNPDKWFDHFADRITLEGTPDALVKWDGKHVLLDFKSSAYNYDGAKTDISLQLNFYAWLLENNGYTVDTLAYIVFNKAVGSIQTPYLVPYERSKAEAMISDMVAHFKRNVGHYEKNPTACVNGKQICPFFKECWNNGT